MCVFSARVPSHTAGMAWPLTQAEEETLCQVLKGKGIASKPWPELNCLGSCQHTALVRHTIGVGFV